MDKSNWVFYCYNAYHGYWDTWRPDKYDFTLAEHIDLSRMDKQPFYVEWTS